MCLGRGEGRRGRRAERLVVPRRVASYRPLGPRSGNFTFDSPSGVTIRWPDSGSVGVFTRGSGAAADEMTGTWNASERVAATKL